ncbi:MAG: bifunctional 4-hydroxy-2-oxoglutarate aldolase/2-dehydro-3-deoxy-phosphogluconate aldolase [Pseudomonadota bacterium]
MQHTISTLLEHSPIIAVITLDDVNHAIPVVSALVEGGVTAIEFTSRTPAGIAAIPIVRETFSDIFLALGSISHASDLLKFSKIGVDLIVTPGLSHTLLDAAKTAKVSILPGISTASDIILGLEYGLRYFKFFPAEALGGIHYLKALSQPFTQCRFCPTGGISPLSMNDYLNMDQVDIVAGTWLAPNDIIQVQQWHKITENAVQAVQILKR